jgi:3-hydroxyisobutyrate dehydrogenase
MNLGWVGLGVMGASMCAHLRRAGHDMTVYTRTRALAEEVLAAGAEWAGTPRAVAEVSDVVFTMVGFPRDVREVALGAGGALEGLRAGGILVDMTTSEPALAVEIAAAARARGAWALDAPVSGGDVGAREARLSIMVGGDAAALDVVRPLFALLGRTIVHHGAPGAGQHAKMVNQTLIASNMVGVCEGLLYAQRAGLDPERVLASVSGGAAGSWSLANLAPRMLAGDFSPGFYVEHFVKDMEIALREAERMQLKLPGLALAKQLYERLAATGHARSGTQALVLALAELSRVEWPRR